MGAQVKPVVSTASSSHLGLIHAPYVLHGLIHAPYVLHGLIRAPYVLHGLIHAPYVLHGVKYIAPVRLAPGRKRPPTSPYSFAQFYISFNNILNIVRYLYEKPPHNYRRCGLTQAQRSRCREGPCQGRKGAF